MLASLIIYASLALADCGTAFDPNWMNCSADADCTVLPDSCGWMRFTVNKARSADVKKFSECLGKTEKCGPLDASAKAMPKFKCESYGGRAGQKPPPARCSRLSDIMGQAIGFNDQAKVESLLAAAEDVDFSLSPIHETPLTLAALNARTEIARLLIGKDAKVNFQTTSGYSPLMFAAMSRDPNKKAIAATIALLLKSGASKSLKNHDGKTALDLASAAKNQEAIQLLK